MNKLELQRQLNELNRRVWVLIQKRHNGGLNEQEARELRTKQNARRKIVNILHPLPPLPTAEIVR